jgi:hypothetical protein
MPVVDRSQSWQAHGWELDCSVEMRSPTKEGQGKSVKPSVPSQLSDCYQARAAENLVSCHPRDAHVHLFQAFPDAEV